MNVIMPPKHLRTLEAHLEAGYPNEAAGFLLGRIDGDIFRVSAVHPLENKWAESSQHNRFRIEPADAARAELAAARQGLDIIGVFHSHPDHAAVPSQWDLEWATWPNFAFLITTVAEGKATVTRAWHLREDRGAFDEDTLTIAGPENE